MFLSQKMKLSPIDTRGITNLVTTRVHLDSYGSQIKGFYIISQQEFLKSGFNGLHRGLDIEFQSSIVVELK